MTMTSVNADFSQIITQNSHKYILAVGLGCLDIVVTCNSYPNEDSDQRCQSVEWRRGGNASNNCSVFSQLGVKCEFLGTIACDYAGKFLLSDLQQQGIVCGNCHLVENAENPTSCVLINAQNGSRTILHSRRNFPELQFSDFKKLDLSAYRWIHFEGRNCDELKKMVSWAEKWRSDNQRGLPISVELEKARSERIDLLPYGDYVFVDKEFAKMCGYACMQTAVEGFAPKIKKGAVVVCAWGEKGACAKKGEDGVVVTSKSFPPPRVVDTLGAGDTFVASTIFALSVLELGLEEAISFGCQIAGAKCGMHGFKGLDLTASQLVL